MDGAQQLDEGKVKELVGTILSHPSFRETLNNLFNNSSSTPTALPSGQSVNRSTPPSNLKSTSRSTTGSISATSTSCGTSSTSRYSTPAEEFSALFRRGSSCSSTPTFQRGVSHRQPNQATRVRRRAASAPYTTSQSSNRPRARDEIFRTKDVVLLPDSKAERIVRAPEKADLMERGYVLSELVVNKTWSEHEVIEYFEDCFKEKLIDTTVVGGTRYYKKYDLN